MEHNQNKLYFPIITGRYGSEKTLDEIWVEDMDALQYVNIFLSQCVNYIKLFEFTSDWTSELDFIYWTLYTTN